MALSWPALAALVAYPVVSWAVRLVGTVATLPLANSERLTHSRAALAILRIGVGGASGGGAMVTSLWLAGRLGGAASPALVAAIVVLLTATHLWGARRLLGTRQYVDDLISLGGEALGALAAAWLWLV